MKRKVRSYLIVLVVLTILTLLLIVLPRLFTDSKVEVNPSTNRAFSLNDQPRSSDGYLDIVVIDALYGTSATAQKTFDKDVGGIFNLISTTSPFKERKAQIRFSKVFTGLNFGCVTQSSTSTIGCDSNQVFAELGNRGIEYDKVILLMNARGGAGHADLGATLAKVPRVSPGSTVHELGHMLGLYDEYIVYRSVAPFTGTDSNVYSGTPPSSTWIDWGIATQYTIGCLYRGAYCASVTSAMRSAKINYFSPAGEYVINQNLDAIVGPSPAPFLRLSTNRTIVKKGANLNLGWFSFGATSCTASGEWSGSKPTHGYQAITLNQSGTYTLTCTNGPLAQTRSVYLIADDQVPFVDTPVVAPVNSLGKLEKGVTISTTASDNIGLAWVRFFVDGRLLATDKKLPYAAGWNTKKTINGPHTIIAEATDLAGHVSTSSPTMVSVDNINTAPTVDLGPDRVVQPGNVQLVAKIIDDALPYPWRPTFKWKMLSGPGPVKFNTTVKSTVTATFSVLGTHDFEVVVYDRQYYATDTMFVIVDNAPITSATSSPIQTVVTLPKNVARRNVTINAIGRAITVSWSKVSGPGEVEFSNSDSFFTNISVDTPGDYVIRRKVTISGRKSIDTNFAVTAND